MVSLFFRIVISRKLLLFQICQVCQVWHNLHQPACPGRFRTGVPPTLTRRLYLRTWKWWQKMSLPCPTCHLFKWASSNGWPIEATVSRQELTRPLLSFIQLFQEIKIYSILSLNFLSRWTNIISILKGLCVTRFFASGFFPESSSPNPLKITIRLIRIFLKIDICKSSLASMTSVANLLPISMTPEANFATGAAAGTCSK